MVDPAVLAVLPDGAEVANVIGWGESGWTETQKVTAHLSGGEKVNYFLKSCAAGVAGPMFKGEFHSLQRLHELLPKACPKPLGWGEYTETPGTYFVIMEFLYFSASGIDAADEISKMIAGVHNATIGTSPGRKFGFDVQTCHGKVIQSNKWDANWTRYFSNLMNTIYEADREANGPFPEYEKVFNLLQTKVIPRLLNALTAEGRDIVPCIVHGDLWQQNIGINEETDKPMIFDPGMFYAHNEFELGMWRVSFVPFGVSHREKYTKYFPKSEPAGEWDDRNRLYSLFFHISHAAHWPITAENTRLLCLEDMRYLVQKYASDDLVKNAVQLNPKAVDANRASDLDLGALADSSTEPSSERPISMNIADSAVDTS